MQRTVCKVLQQWRKQRVKEVDQVHLYICHIQQDGVLEGFVHHAVRVTRPSAFGQILRG